MDRQQKNGQQAGGGLFITATGTDVGKTYVTGLLIKKLRQAGYNAGYYKAALSGTVRVGGSLIPGDADYVNREAELGASAKEMVPYIYENAVSPHLAAQIEGNPVEMKTVVDGFLRAAKQYDYLTMEGSGGIVCPIRYDGPKSGEVKIFLEDLIRELNLPSVIVADAGLGTINATVLTAEYMRNRNLEVKGIILNRCHIGSRLEEDNKKMVEELTKIPVIACVGEGSNELDTDAGFLAALYGRQSEKREEWK